MTAVAPGFGAGQLDAAQQHRVAAVVIHRALAEALEAGTAHGVFALNMDDLAAPLPRAYEFVDGSAYLPHVERVRRARNAEVPQSFYVDPLMYQATSAQFLGAHDPVQVVSEDYGIDLEAEVIVVTDDVPMAVTPEQAAEIARDAGVRFLLLNHIVPDRVHVLSAGRIIRSGGPELAEELEATGYGASVAAA